MIDRLSYDKKHYVRGFFKIELLDSNGNLLDTFEKENTVVTVSRTTLAKHMAGQLTTPINKIIFGTQGAQSSGQPKDVPVDRTQLFSQESSGFIYNLSFTPPSSNGNATGITEDNQGSGSTVEVTCSNNIITYNIKVPEAAANGSSGTTVYTECGMFTGSTLFAMRTFAARSKDANSVLSVTWTFIF